MSGRKTDPKLDTLRQLGCLHPHPKQVSDPLFSTSEFFDARDLLQVKYEMLRRVHVDGHAVSQTAADFGLSRPSFYQAQALYEKGGLPALLPKKPGPRRAHKLSEEVVDVLCKVTDQEPDTDSATLVRLVKKRFGVSVHRRSVERALAKRKKKPQPPRTT